ncbi:Thioredoxin M-type, chloroplastic [Linum perenne]
MSAESSIGISSSLRQQLPHSRLPAGILRRSVDYRLTDFRGVKVQTPWKNLALVARSPRLRNRNPRMSIVCEAQEAAAVDMPAVTDETWESLVLEAKGPVLVEFWAPWCGPCRMAHPVVAEISRQYAGKVKFFKMNTDDSPSTATRYGIRSIPTIIIFVDGVKRDAIIGAVPKTTLTATLEKLL